MENYLDERFTIMVKGVKYYFDIIIDSNEYFDLESTLFYREKKTKTYKKYWLFGPTIEKIEPEYEFSVCFNILSDTYTKSEVKIMVELMYDRMLELKNRKSELERGEII